MKAPTQARPGIATNQLTAPAETLRDFTTTWRVLPITGLALVIGVVAAYVAVALLKLINFFTNVFFFHRLSSAAALPGNAHLGPWVIAVPVVGAVIVGLMARFGSDKIRGHGIPEAIEAILLRGAKVEPKLAVLKPVSAAIAIGSGGPFGAEGPIIMTGGALGSLIAQFFHLASAERKTLLVAGAAAGMSATFAAPFASILLAIELLLFEWKPRSFIPVALASVTAEAARVHLLGAGPVFPVPPHDAVFSPAILFGCLLAGILSGGLSALLTQLVYAVEDGFAHLKKIHWMWWPAIGSLAVGIGGLVFPRALGVGYDVIQQLLQALISMGAMLAGTMRSPLTGVIFAFELTGDYHSILPLLIACVSAHTFTVLTMSRSILTEKISRRGHHLSREYVVDPLEALAVEDVMRTNITAFPAESTIAELETALAHNDNPRGQRVYPVIDGNQHLLGVMTRYDLLTAIANRRKGGRDNVQLSEVIAKTPVVAFPEEPLRMVVNRMAATGLTRFPVVTSNGGPKLAGLIGLQDLLKARELSVADEHHRERVLRLRVPPSLRWRGLWVSRGGSGTDTKEI